MSEKFRRTKIITTLGPATDRNNNLEKIILAGANVVRMNFSHGTSDDHKMRANQVRKIAKKLERYIAILGDLQGPKIRISSFKEERIILYKGDKFLLDVNLKKKEGDNKKVGINYLDLPKDVIPDDVLLLDDSRVQLKVLKVNKTKIFTEVIIGGPLSDNKGINKLGGGLSAKSLTEKDKIDIFTASQIDVDYLAVSFPRCGEDLHEVRRFADSINFKTKIVAKIERAEAVCNRDIMDDIILSSDVVMVARGDLGVEIGYSELVGIQKTIIRRARQLNRAVITATQMMESMINNLTPTRAEVMDVANAVLDGTDAVMLSAETAIGNYPVETVTTMALVCLGAEKIPSMNISKHRLDQKFNNIEETIAMSAMYAANHLKGVKAIVTMTESGRTALIMSRISSRLPIFALSHQYRTLNLTSLYRGVTPIFFKNKEVGMSEVNEAIHLLGKKGILTSGDIVIFTQGDVSNTIDSTNTIRVIKI